VSNAHDWVQDFVDNYLVYKDRVGKANEDAVNRYLSRLTDQVRDARAVISSEMDSLNKKHQQIQSEQRRLNMEKEEKNRIGRMLGDLERELREKRAELVELTAQVSAQKNQVNRWRRMREELEYDYKVAKSRYENILNDQGNQVNGQITFSDAEKLNVLQRERVTLRRIIDHFDQQRQGFSEREKNLKMMRSKLQAEKKDMQISENWNQNMGDPENKGTGSRKDSTAETKAESPQLQSQASLQEIERKENALMERESQIDQREIKMEKWFQGFQESQVRAMEEAKEKGQESTLTRMDKQFAALFMKSTLSMADVRKELEVYLQTAKERNMEEWHELTLQKGHFEIEKAKVKTELRKARATREQWEGKKADLERELAEVDRKSRSVENLRKEVTEKMDSLNLEKSEIDQKRAEIARLMDEQREDRKNLQSEKERLSVEQKQAWKKFRKVSPRVIGKSDNASEGTEMSSKKLDIRSQQLDRQERRLKGMRTDLDRDLENLTQDSNALEAEKRKLSHQKQDLERQKIMLERGRVELQKEKLSFKLVLRDREQSGGSKLDKAEHLPEGAAGERKKLEGEWAQIMKEKEKQLNESAILMNQREEILREREKLELEQQRFKETMSIKKGNLEQMKKINTTVEDHKQTTNDDGLTKVKSDSVVISLRERLKQDKDRLEMELKKSEEEKLEWRKQKQKMQEEFQNSKQDLDKEKMQLKTEKLKVAHEVQLINEGTSQLHKLKSLLDELRETEM